MGDKRKGCKADEQSGTEYQLSVNKDPMTWQVGIQCRSKALFFHVMLNFLTRQVIFGDRGKSGVELK